MICMCSKQTYGRNILLLRAVGRSENPVVSVVIRWALSFPLVEIGLTDLPKSGGAMATPTPPGTTRHPCYFWRGSVHCLSGQSKAAQNVTRPRYHARTSERKQTIPTVKSNFKGIFMKVYFGYPWKLPFLRPQNLKIVKNKPERVFGPQVR